MSSKIIVLLAIGFLASCSGGCATGIGRAWNQAWTGTPPEVVESVQFMNKVMIEELQSKYDAVESAPVTNSDGKVVKSWAENRFRDMELINAQLERWERLSEALGDYLGFKLTDDTSQSRKEATKRRKEFWKALYDGTKKAIKEE